MKDLVKMIKKYYLSSSKIMIEKNSMNNYIINNNKVCNRLKFFPSTTLDTVEEIFDKKYEYFRKLFKIGFIINKIEK